MQQMNTTEPFFTSYTLGKVFQTSDEWCKWLREHNGDTRSPVTTFHGFEYNVNNVCTNAEDAVHFGDHQNYYHVLIAETPKGWTYSIEYQWNLGGGSSWPSWCCPWNKKLYSTKKEAIHHGVMDLYRIAKRSCEEIAKQKVSSYYDEDEEEDPRKVAERTNATMRKIMRSLEADKQRYDLRQLSLFDF